MRENAIQLRTDLKHEAGKFTILADLPVLIYMDFYMTGLKIKTDEFNI